MFGIKTIDVMRTALLSKLINMQVDGRTLEREGREGGSEVLWNDLEGTVSEYVINKN